MLAFDKLRDTVTQVEELRKSLAIKRTQLEAKDAEANEKLKRMVADQQEAEQKRLRPSRFKLHSSNKTSISSSAVPLSWQI